MADAPTRHGRGLAVVIALAVIFFTLLGLIVLTSNDGPDDPAARGTETLTVMPVRIRIRTEPQARAAVVTTATSGERLKLLEDRGSWVRVQNSEGLEGWAERSNLERTAERERRLKRYATIRKLPPLKGETTEDVQLYAGPGIFYPIVGNLASGRDVVVYTRDHDFFAVEHGDAVAYADADSIDISASGTTQLDVQTSTADTPLPTDTASPLPAETPTETAFTPEPPPLSVPEPEPIERTTGVYSAVPPGGTQPQEVDRVIPRYPPSARRAGVQGTVVIRGIVRRDGTIDNLEIIKDLPHGLGDEARRAVSRWQFRPATVRGEPIDVYYTVTVNFRLQ
jgi:TonB family protein